jgi:tungstate transport system substrate-binding protein
MKKKLLHLFLLGVISLQCMASQTPNSTIKLATTTSTDNSGLLRFLLPRFEADTHYRVHVIAVGTGKALRMGKDGDVDAVLVHALKAEEEFVKAGFGEKRHALMYNDFVIVGPTSDTADIALTKNPMTAFSQIKSSNSLFTSRGDNSGTHKKELSLWQSAQITPRGDWYREIGQGMGKTLQIAGELNAYTLTDRGTWLAYQDKSPLRILFQGGVNLHNPYGIIAISPKRYPDTNQAGAQALIRWLTSTKGQQLIGSYTLHGSRLFTPSAHGDSMVAHEIKP